MKKRTIIILLIIFVALIGGRIVAWKLSSNKEKNNSSSQQKDNPSPTPLNKLSDPELEKCLLEDFSRRLELKKYFVFNLGKEVEEAPGDPYNNRLIKRDLSNDLTKLTATYEKKLEEKGYGLLLGKFGSITYKRIPKDRICFVKKDFARPSSEWKGDKINEKITNGKNCYIVFEKDNDGFPRNYFKYEKTDETGKQWFAITNGIYLVIEGASTTIICENKEKALEILKTDPAISGEN